MTRCVSLLAALALACAATPPPAPAPEVLAAQAEALAARLAAAPPPPPGALRVRLAFGPEADLDLYVTDPLQETVYFANNPSRSGGRLLADVRCDTKERREETVIFDRPASGVYRVGVDFPEACGKALDPVPFVVVLEAGGKRWERRGTIRLGSFEYVVLETAVEGVGPPPPSAP